MPTVAQGCAVDRVDEEASLLRGFLLFVLDGKGVLLGCWMHARGGLLSVHGPYVMRTLPLTLERYIQGLRDLQLDMGDEADSDPTYSTKIPTYSYTGHSCRCSKSATAVTAIKYDLLG
jgi:hypothetical protein